MSCHCIEAYSTVPVCPRQLSAAEGMHCEDVPSLSFPHSCQTQQQKITSAHILKTVQHKAYPNPAESGCAPPTPAQHIWNFKDKFWVPQEMRDIDRLRSSNPGSQRCPGDGSAGQCGQKWRKLISSLRKTLQQDQFAVSHCLLEQEHLFSEAYEEMVRQQA